MKLSAASLQSICVHYNYHLYLIGVLYTHPPHVSKATRGTKMQPPPPSIYIPIPPSRIRCAESTPDTLWIFPSEVYPALDQLGRVDRLRTTLLAVHHLDNERGMCSRRHTSFNERGFRWIRPAQTAANAWRRRHLLHKFTLLSFSKTRWLSRTDTVPE